MDSPRIGRGIPCTVFEWNSMEFALLAYSILYLYSWFAWFGTHLLPRDFVHSSQCLTCKSQQLADRFQAPLNREPREGSSPNKNWCNQSHLNRPSLSSSLALFFSGTSSTFSFKNVRKVIVNVVLTRVTTLSTTQKYRNFAKTLFGSGAPWRVTCNPGQSDIFGIHLCVLLAWYFFELTTYMKWDQNSEATETWK